MSFKRKEISQGIIVIIVMIITAISLFPRCIIYKRIVKNDIIYIKNSLVSADIADKRIPVKTELGYLIYYLFLSRHKYKPTPLIVSIKNDRREIFTYLIELGANPNKPDTSGITPMEWAQGIPRKEFYIETLAEHGAKRPVPYTDLNDIDKSFLVHAGDQTKEMAK